MDNVEIVNATTDGLYDFTYQGESQKEQGGNRCVPVENQIFMRT